MVFSEKSEKSEKSFLGSEKEEKDLIFDLFCDEEVVGGGFGDDGVKMGDGFGGGGGKVESLGGSGGFDGFWEHEEVLELLCKEKEVFLLGEGLGVEERKEAVEWILKVVAHYGFSGLTGVLAVGYFDRFVCSVYFQKDKPWMSQLVAVACVSIAAKMEEIQVPLLLDLQVENCKFAFEAKTIMKMELLVLYGLKWRFSIVTPISFFDHFVRRFGSLINDSKAFIKRCEDIVLFAIADSRIVCYLPSVVATATTLFVFNEIDLDDVMDCRNQLLDVLGTDKEKVDECYQFISEVISSQCHVQYGIHKRKQVSVPGSPSGVIDAYMSCDSSNDAWPEASSILSSPKPFFKRSKAQDQHMRLFPLSNFSTGMCGRFC